MKPGREIVEKATGEETLPSLLLVDDDQVLCTVMARALQRREYDARFPGARYQLIMIDGEPAGRIWTGGDEEQIRLLDIALLPQFQRRGAGTVLLRDLMKEADDAGKFLRHMVFVLNNDAHRFYERLGFVVIEDLGAYKHMEWKGSE